MHVYTTVKEIQSFLTIILEEIFGFQRIDLITKADYPIDAISLEKLQKVVQGLIRQKPIQYILGKTEFFGLPFHVNKYVLIPRPETEELVEWILQSIDAQQKNSRQSEVKILDIGTGSGCIPIALKKNIPSADISAIDISAKALEVAQNNAELNEVEIEFIQQDILQASQDENAFRTEKKPPFSNIDEDSSKIHRQDIKYDIIVSNPPYVRELEKAEMKANVLKNEPKLALFVSNEDPLIFYRNIAELAKKQLKENGMLFFEINQYLGREMISLLDILGFKDIKLKKDIFGNDRMIKATI